MSRYPKHWNKMLASWGQLMESYAELVFKVSHLEQTCALQQRALARIIGKLDPLYGIPEDDPQRISKDKELADRVIAQLKGEYEVQKQQNPDMYHDLPEGYLDR
jgi:hypothetical protein